MSAFLQASAGQPSPTPIAVSTPQLPPPSATPSFALGEESPRATRRGRANYTSMDIGALLDIVGEILPLGANMWAEVASEYALWAETSGRPPRDQDSLKGKFDKLANTKKDTGNPSCPPEVRRAKHISRDILGSCYAASAGDGDAMEPLPPVGQTPPSDGGAGGGDDSCGGSGGAPANIRGRQGGGPSPIGHRNRIRAVAAGGVAKRKTKDPLVASVEMVAANMAAITEAIAAPAPLAVADIVREEVAKAMDAHMAKAMEAHANKLEEMKKFIVELARK